MQRTLRIICGALIVAVLLTVTGITLAAELSFRNNVHFGDSLRTVKQKESGSPSEEEANKLRYFDIIDTKFAYITYRFDPKTSDLYEVVYEYIDMNDLPSATKWYNKMEQKLKDEYGEAINNQYGTACTVISDEFRTAIEWQNTAKDTDEALYEIKAYNEWLTNYGNEKMKIDLFSAVIGAADPTEIFDLTEICYHLFTESDYQALQDDIDAAATQSATEEMKKDFEWKDGIAFGDSKKDVMSKHATESGYEMEDNGNQVVYKDSTKAYGMYSSHLEKYNFTSNSGNLWEIVIEHDTFLHEDEALDWYDEQLAKLTDEYGEPLGLRDGETYDITGTALQTVGHLKNVSNYYSMTEGGDMGYDLVSYEEWVLDCGQYKVKIELVYSTMLGAAYSNMISYTYFQDGTESSGNTGGSTAGSTGNSNRSASIPSSVKDSYKYGTTDNSIIRVKERLRDLGYFSRGAKFSAEVNDTLKDAVIQFQKKNGLNADGVLDTKLFEVLFSDGAVRK